ncbi:hypothetical protein D1872_348290 [compost metagenome]
MADYCISLLTDDELTSRVREACLQRAKTEFSSDIITAAYEAIYYRVLNRKLPRLKPACG